MESNLSYILLKIVFKMSFDYRHCDCKVIYRPRRDSGVSARKGKGIGKGEGKSGESSRGNRANGKSISFTPFRFQSNVPFRRAFRAFPALRARARFSLLVDSVSSRFSLTDKPGNRYPNMHCCRFFNMADEK